MEKAYDVKALLEELKAAGVEVAEDVLFKILDKTSDWAIKSAAMGQNGVVDALVIGAVPVVKQVLTPLIDKVDGKEG
jgi:hypothetical protein